jgi:hypothetical protein
LAMQITTLRWCRATVSRNAAEKIEETGLMVVE